MATPYIETCRQKYRYVLKYTLHNQPVSLKLGKTRYQQIGEKLQQKVSQLCSETVQLQAGLFCNWMKEFII